MGQQEDDVRSAMLKAMPGLRGYAISLTRSNDRAEDLVQDTLLKALAHIEDFEPGSNMDGWLTVIARNTFITQIRRRAREVQDSDGTYAEKLTSPPEQLAWLEIQRVKDALSKLSSDKRRVIELTVLEGYSEKEAATICRCEPGTIKSRRNRAREHLRELLDPDEEDFDQALLPVRF